MDVFVSKKIKQRYEWLCSESNGTYQQGETMTILAFTKQEAEAEFRRLKRVHPFVPVMAIRKQG